MERSAADGTASADPTAELEMALIHEYLAEQHRMRQITTAEQLERVWKDALLHASLQLEAVRARAHLMGSLHNQPTGM